MAASRANRAGTFRAVKSASEEQAELVEGRAVAPVPAEEPAVEATRRPEPEPEPGPEPERTAGSALAELEALRARRQGRTVLVHGVKLSLTPDEQTRMVGTTINMPKPLREAIRVGQQLTGKTYQEFACWAMGLALEQLTGEAGRR